MPPHFLNLNRYSQPWILNDKDWQKAAICGPVFGGLGFMKPPCKPLRASEERVPTPVHRRGTRHTANPYY